MLHWQRTARAALRTPPALLPPNSLGWALTWASTVERSISTTSSGVPRSSESCVGGAWKGGRHGSTLQTADASWPCTASKSPPTHRSGQHAHPALPPTLNDSPLLALRDRLTSCAVLSWVLGLQMRAPSQRTSTVLSSAISSTRWLSAPGPSSSVSPTAGKGG